MVPARASLRGAGRLHRSTRLHSFVGAWTEDVGPPLARHPRTCAASLRKTRTPIEAPGWRDEASGQRCGKTTLKDDS